MYQYSYSEVLSDSPVDSRIQERLALDHAIMLLQAAVGTPPQSSEEQAALTFTTQLWGIFINDLSDPGNDLPAEVRGRLISIGLWVMGETQRIGAGASRDFGSIADVCGLIRDGLN